MRTIAIVSQKGGAGKTTLAVHLAAAAARHFVTLVIDTDPQATASRWGQWRGGRDPEVIDCGAPSLLPVKLSKAAELGAELAIIDTPPHADAMARQAARAADLVLVPCRPRAFDLAAMELTAELVRSTRAPTSVVLNGGPPNAPLVHRDAHELLGSGGLDGLGLRVAPFILAERAAFHHAVSTGATVIETDPLSKAAGEIEALWAWTCEQLGMGTREQVTEPAA